MPLPIWALILIMIALTAVQFLLTPRVKAPAAEKFDVPTTSEDRNIPILYGTARVKSPNTVWWGDTGTRKKTKQSLCTSTTLGYYYFVGMLWVIAWGGGGGGRLRGIYQEGKQLWTGSATDGDELFIDKSKLFGDNAGGVVYKLTFGGGLGVAAADPYLQAQNGGYSPSYNRFVTILSKGFSSQDPAYKWNGYIGMSPQPRPIEFETERLPDGIGIRSLTSASTNDEGWTLPLGGTGLTWDNTNKWLKWNDLGSASMAVRAPSSFNGDLSTSYQRTLAFELWADSIGTQSVNKSVDIYNGSNFIRWTYSPAPVPGWNNYAPVLATSSGWTYNDSVTAATGGQIQAILANVTRMDFRADIRESSTTEEVRLRNVSLVTASGGILDPNGTGDRYDANPAVVLYDLMTDPIYGGKMVAGDEFEGIDVASFVAAAATLEEEQFGLTVFITESIKLKDAAQEILRHIDGALFKHPETGLHTLKLFRDDYDPDTIPVIDEDIFSEVTEYQFDGVNGLKSSVICKFTDRANEYKTRPAIVHNPAIVQILGRQDFAEIDYPYCHRADLAGKIATRDALLYQNPLVKLKLRSIRQTAAQLVPGDVFRFNSSKYGTNLVMRVLRVDYGKLTESAVEVHAIQDKFSLGEAVFSTPAATWSANDATALNVTYRRAEEMPYFYARDTLPRIAALAAAPNANHLGYDLDTKEGSGAYLEADQLRDFAVRSTLVNPISGYEDADDTGSWVVASNSGVAALGSFTADQQRAGLNLALIGNEIISFEGVTSVTGGYRLDGVRHGALDTVPAAHAAGDEIWFVTAAGASFGTNGFFTAGATVTCRFRPFTPSDGINDPNGNTAAVTLDGRATRPLPPANITVNGAYRGATAVGYITLEWSERNRLTQADVRYQDDATITPEAGTTYTIRVYNESDTLIRTETGITDTTYDYTETMMVTDTGGVPEYVRFEIEAVRDGLTSWQPQSIRVEYIEP